jgi:hypothetical protein
MIEKLDATMRPPATAVNGFSSAVLLDGFWPGRRMYAFDGWCPSSNAS